MNDFHFEHSDEDKQPALDLVEGESPTKVGKKSNNTQSSVMQSSERFKPL